MVKQILEEVFYDNLPSHDEGYCLSNIEAGI
jgi:hypothetical protein